MANKELRSEFRTSGYKVIIQVSLYEAIGQIGTTIEMEGSCYGDFEFDRAIKTIQLERGKLEKQAHSIIGRSEK